MIFILIGFILRILLAIYNSEYQLLPGIGGDAFRFHLEALNFQNYLEERKFTQIDYKYEVGWFYSVFLGYLYYIFQASYLFSSILSCIVWLISSLVFRKILLRIKIDNFKVNCALFVYCFLFPISIIYSSVVLREVYMLCFINFMVLYFIILVDQKRIFFIFKNFIIILSLLFLLGIFHRSNVIFVLLFLGSIFLYYIIQILDLKIKSLLLIGIVSTILFYYLGYMENLFYIIKDYQVGHIHPTTEARAAYYSEVEIRSITFSFLNFFKYILGNIMNYFIQPSIFKVDSISDIILLFENYIRLFMIICVIIKLFKYPSNNHLFHIFILMFFLSEAPYSQATINWGTASRHHTQIIGLLIILFLYPKKNK